MSVQDFFNKYNNRPIDFDGYYGYQCMDLYHQYNKEVVGGANIAAPIAAQVWSKNLYPTASYAKIANTPNGIPQVGDVIIWNTYVAGAGHIAVVSSANLYTFTSFDQNWPVGSWCHFQPHNYTNVYGWLRPRTFAVPVGDDELLNKIKAVVDGSGNPSTKITSIRTILK